MTWFSTNYRANFPAFEHIIFVGLGRCQDNKSSEQAQGGGGRRPAGTVYSEIHPDTFSNAASRAADG